jgi:CubicO group peptidase (beta-lactamase class C family)
MNKSLYYFLSLTLVFGSLSFTACAQQPRYSPEVESRIKAVEESLFPAVRVEGQAPSDLKARMAYYKVPGLTVAVVQNYKIEWARGYGFADVETKRPVTTETLFQAASISKSLNGVGVVKLAQDRKVDLKADINTYLKSWKFPYDSLSGNKTISLENLLSHTAGTSVHGFRGYAKSEAIPTLTQILNGQAPANSAAIRSMFAPDTRVQYSGGGTTITQQIVIDVTGLPYEDYMRENVLKPMGMNTSFYKQPKNVNASLLATAYHEDGSEVPGKYHMYPEMAAASLWTNPTELSRYIIETQLSLQGKSKKVLSKEFTTLRLTPHMGNAGLGVFIDTKTDSKYFQHGGANEGFRSQYYGNMENGNGVVVMVNSDNGAIIQEVIRSVASVYGWKGFDSEVRKVVTMTDEQLKAFEGFYQFTQDQKTYLNFSVSDHQLVLTQLWDGRKINFTPESEVDFFCKDFPFPLKFTKNASGEVTQVLAFNRDVWKKDPAYKPVTRTPIKLAPDKLKVLEGKYQLQQNKDLYVTITAQDDHLLVKQLWNGEETIFVAESELEFFQKDNQYFPIRFIRNQDGAVKQILAFNRDMLDKVE